jgi:hypothetical protein
MDVWIRAIVLKSSTRRLSDAVGFPFLGARMLSDHCLAGIRPPWYASMSVR